MDPGDTLSVARRRTSPNDRVIDAARSSVLLANLPSPTLGCVLDESSYLEAARDATLLHEGSDRIVLLMAGSAKRWATTPRGDRIVTQLVGPGQVVGMPAVLGYPGVAGTVTTLDSSELLTVPGPHARRLIDQEPSFARACLRTVAAELADLRAEQTRLSGGSARDRIVERLLQLWDQFGVQRSGHVRIDVPLTQEDLASWAGVSRESAARALQELRSRGLVRTGRRQISIEDGDGLEALRPGAAPSVASTTLISTLRDTR